MTLDEFQELIEQIYYEKDSGRGVYASFAWFVEEVGELARALVRGDKAARTEEVGDVLAWLSTLASIVGVRLEDAATKYANGCPKCHRTPCRCD